MAATDGVHASLRRQRAWAATFGVRVFPDLMLASGDGGMPASVDTTTSPHLTLSTRTLCFPSLDAASVLPRG
nr:hypothetical protein [uncultured Pseudoxanthomonas sp.]